MFITTKISSLLDLDDFGEYYHGAGWWGLGSGPPEGLSFHMLCCSNAVDTNVGLSWYDVTKMFLDIHQRHPWMHGEMLMKVSTYRIICPQDLGKSPSCSLLKPVAPSIINIKPQCWIFNPFTAPCVLCHLSCPLQDLDQPGSWSSLGSSLCFHGQALALSMFLSTVIFIRDLSNAGDIVQRCIDRSWLSFSGWIPLSSSVTRTAEPAQHVAGHLLEAHPMRNRKKADYGFSESRIRDLNPGPFPQSVITVLLPLLSFVMDFTPDTQLHKHNPPQQPLS